jgi:hypothetical protein
VCGNQVHGQLLQAWGLSFKVQEANVRTLANEPFEPKLAQKDWEGVIRTGIYTRVL